MIAQECDTFALSSGELEQFFATRGTLLQPAGTLKDMMELGYTYLILADEETCKYLSIARKEHDEKVMKNRKGSKRKNA